MPIPGNFLSATTEMVDPNTSGWTVKLNSAALTKGAGGRNGDGCLTTKAIAVGEVQARTVSSYPVTAGTLYETFADASGTSVERIGIRWLTAAGAEVSITWSLTTLSAATQWHRVSVAGVAPAGATQAQVVLSSTETAINALHYWENVYLGLPIRTQGNLFGFNTESSEVDASQWTPVVNATISRQVPPYGWSVDWYTAGGHMLVMTATAAGNASIAAIDRPPATPGVEYIAHAYLQPPTLSSTAWIELRFYDANNNQIAAKRAVLAAPNTNVLRQRVSGIAPANTASASVAVGLDGASAGQILRVETVVLGATNRTPSGNVVPYEDASFEQGIGQWTTVSGPATLARTTPWGTGAEASYALAMTSTTATASVIRSGRYLLPSVEAGQHWRTQIYAHIAAGGWNTIGVRSRWYDAAGADLGTTAVGSFTLPGSGWYALYVDSVVPDGATQAAVEFLATATATNSVMHLDLAALWQVLPLISVGARSADGYLELTLRELNVGDTISVYREMPDGSRALVRGASGLIDRQPITADLLVVEDHEAPLNVPVRYYVEIYDGAGDMSTRISAYQTLTLTDINEAWIKDPGNPQRNLKVLVEKAPDWSRPIEQSAYVIKGRRNKVVLAGRRQGLEGDLAIWTRTDEERRALHLLLDSGNTLFWQAVPGMGVDDMYVNVGAVTEGRIGTLAQEPWREWALPLIEADRPVTTGINGSGGRTWADVIAEFPTCADVTATYATNEALLLDRR